MEPIFDDPYHKRRLELPFGDGVLRFDTAALLPHAHAIDPGARLLLAELAPQLGAPRAILELGCGYGLVGVTLARLRPAARVVLADQELLALRYAAHNGAFNGCENVTTVGSIGVGDLPPGDFDLIVVRVPPKINDRAVEHDFVLGPLGRLAPGGACWFLCDLQLNRLVPKLARQRRLPIAEVARGEGAIIYRARREAA